MTSFGLYVIMLDMIKTREASRTRRRLRDIVREMDGELEALLRHRSLLQGTVYRSERRCGKRSCRCAAGALHAAWVASVKVNGARTTRGVPASARREAVRLAAGYRAFRRARRAFLGRCEEARMLIGELEGALSVEWKEVEARWRKRR